jgi:hypothetical protein
MPPAEPQRGQRDAIRQIDEGRAVDHLHLFVQDGESRAKLLPAWWSLPGWLS